MGEEEKVVRLLVSVRELESSLKKFAESAKEKSADVHSFAKVLREIENLPTIDPESDIEFKCSKCEGIISTDWDGIEDFEYCPYCGARMGGFCMTIGAAMLGAFLLLLLVVTITLAIIGLVRLLVDRPVALFSIVFAVLFILLTIWLYVGGNAV